MALSVAAALRSADVAEHDRVAVERAHAIAMAPRVSAFDDDHHPAYLHPGRSVLILLRDVGSVPPRALAAAAVLESEDDDLRVPVDRIRTELGDDLADAVAATPRPGDEALAERLLLLPPDIVLAALAERLDHLRHLHLRPELERVWVDRHEEVARVWHPFAERTDRTLSRRYAHWARTFGRRLGRR